MENEYFQITANAFHVLKADYTSNRKDISELVDDAEFDEVFLPEQIQRAQQSLIAPLARLEQEISWLPEISQTQVSSFLELINSGDLDSLMVSMKHSPELAKVNALVHFCGIGNVTNNLFHAILTTWDEIDQPQVLSFINEKRESAGFPNVEAHQLQDAIKKLEKLHARTAAFGIWTLDRPGEVMDRIVEAELIRHPSSSFLEQFVRCYDTMSEPELVRVSDEIDKLVELANLVPSIAAPISAISDALTEWDDINQPVQVYEQHQGHEEGRSKRIYEKLRSLCLDLANNRGEFAEALQLSEALLRTFPELESVAEVLKKDVAQLEKLDEQQRQDQFIDPLVAACEEAKDQMSRMKKSLAKYGFSTKSKGPVSNILSAFKETLSKISEKSNAYLVVRDLALYINNERNDPETAFRLMDGLIAYSGASPSNDLREKLEEDRRVLHQNWKMNELKKNAGNPTAMLEIVNDLLKYASGVDRTELQQLKTQLERKQLGKKVKWSIYASIAAIIGFFVIADELDRPSKPSVYQPSTSRSVASTPSLPIKNTNDLETRPPVGRGLLLNRSQVRYCIFQGQRLEKIRALTDKNHQVKRFNGLIDDFNTRCSNYRYRSGVLGSIQREANEKSTEFQADAKRIVLSW